MENIVGFPILSVLGVLWTLVLRILKFSILSSENAAVGHFSCFSIISCFPDKIRPLKSK